MPTLQVEGPHSGWVATIGYDDVGHLRVLEARDDWEGDTQQLLARLLQEPSPSGRIPGEHVRPDDEEVLYDLAASLSRRKPECRGERLVGYVVGGGRFVDTADTYDYGPE